MDGWKCHTGGEDLGLLQAERNLCKDVFGDGWDLKNQLGGPWNVLGDFFAVGLISVDIEAVGI